MQHLIALVHEAAHGGITLGRATVRVGRASLQVVVKIFFTR